MCRISRCAAIARRIALSNQDERCAYLLGAIVVKGNRVIAEGVCTSKSDPKNPKHHAGTPRTQICAEVRAALKALRILNTDTLAGCTIYVVRTTKANRQYNMAQPCEYCQAFLTALQVKCVYYSNRDGDIERMNLPC